MDIDVFSRLRASLDGNDPFVSGGHGIIKTAGATRHAERMKKVPVWALDDEKIRDLVERCFPKARTSQKQQASRMVRVVYMYYRVGMTAQAIADELKTTLKAIKMVLYRLQKVVNTPKTPRGPKPKIIPEAIDATIEGSGDDSYISL